jgi:hypothetical protein
MEVDANCTGTEVPPLAAVVAAEVRALVIMVLEPDTVNPDSPTK